ncbi:hypothetical protein QL285_021788 [Trifolium repens]|nr:hypothetical protein QL285_021788 [Trifolium repens]
MKKKQRKGELQEGELDNSFDFKNVHHMKKEIVNLEEYVTEVGNKWKREEFEKESNLDKLLEVAFQQVNLRTFSLLSSEFSINWLKAPLME